MFFFNFSFRNLCGKRTKGRESIEGMTGHKIWLTVIFYTISCSLCSFSFRQVYFAAIPKSSEQPPIAFSHPPHDRSHGPGHRYCARKNNDSSWWCSQSGHVTVRQSQLSHSAQQYKTKLLPEYIPYLFKCSFEAKNLIVFILFLLVFLPLYKMSIYVET